MRFAALVLCGILGACATHGNSPAQAALTDSAPQSASAIESLLLAHHAQDLPGSAALHAHDGAKESLLYLGENAELLLVRARAIASLRFFPARDVDAFLSRLLSSSRTHAKLLAAALHGCEGSEDDALLDRARGFVTHADPRVRRAAQRLLPGSTGGSLRP